MRREREESLEGSSSPLPPSLPPSLLPCLLFPGFRHDSIPTAIEAFKQQGPLYNISFSFSEDPALFSDDGLNEFDAIAFVSNSDEGEPSFVLSLLLLIVVIQLATPVLLLFLQSSTNPERMPSFAGFKREATSSESMLVARVSSPQTSSRTRLEPSSTIILRCSRR